MSLQIKDIYVEVEGKEILHGVSLDLEEGKIHALMGPNGSGKTTLANTLMGHPKYKITSGTILFNGEDITNLAADERARRGLFLSFQYPKEIPGVSITNFLRTAINSKRKDSIPIPEFRKLLEEKMALLNIDKKMVGRYLNEGFSGGEKKRAEILQMLMLDPILAILDETDSGLDIDALRIVSQGINAYFNEHKTVLIITHYKRILEMVRPNTVTILAAGKIAHQGDGSIIDTLEAKGYAWLGTPEQQ